MTKAHVAQEIVTDIVQDKVCLVHIDDDPSRLPGVGFDAEKAGFMITDLFLRQGCTKIAFIDSPLKSYTFRSRLEGFYSAHRKAGITPDPLLVKEVAGTTQGGVEAFHWLMNLDELPQAVVVYTDVVAHALQSKLVQAGIKIPNQLGIASIDDTDYSQLMIPPLTSVHVPAYEIGEQAARMMLRMLSGKELESKYELMDIQMNIRESSSIPVHAPTYSNFTKE